MSMTDEFDLLAADLQNDPDLDVTVRDRVLFVNATRFAYLGDIALTLRLPQARARDLAGRGVGRRLDGDPDTGAEWVSVTDRDDWRELAGEAHEFARGRLPGHDS